MHHAIFFPSLLLVAASASPQSFECREGCLRVCRSCPHPELFPSLAPDGTSFVYTARPNDNWDIFLQRVGGTHAINLIVDSPGDDDSPASRPTASASSFSQIATAAASS